MKFHVCNNICKKCPFAKGAIGGWLGPYDSPEELHQLIMLERPFPCHMKQDKEIKNDEVGTKRFPLCRGALAYMKKAAKLPKNLDLREAMDTVTQEDKKKVFSVPEFIDHHTITNKTEEQI